MNFTFVLLVLSTFYVNLPFVNMREGPSDHTKVETQAIYSEAVNLLTENEEGWTKIQTPDKAEGWILKSSLYETSYPSSELKGALIATVSRPAAHVYAVKDTEYGPLLTLPFESKVEVTDQFGENQGRWLEIELVDGKKAYIQRGDINLDPKILTQQEALELAHEFEGLPYTWGGRSSFGYDCSGFVQMLYHQMGYQIPRNSRDQATWKGFQEISFDQLQPADLVFFGPEDKKITHVGMYLGNNEFIHATVAENKPYIHISNLSDSVWNGSGKLKFHTARTLKN